MIVDERYTDYINSLTGFLEDDLEELYEKAKANRIPVIRRETQALLGFLITEKQPCHILEVGTAIGFSALFMSGFLPKDGRITTIEKYEKRIPIARENFRRFGREKQIKLLEGDAMQILANLPQESYDMVFMDAAKGQYIHFLPLVKKVLAPGGVLISDNVLQDGQIIESRFAVTRRDRTIHERMREYLYALTHDDELVSSVLTVGDGVALSVKKKGRETC